MMMKMKFTTNMYTQILNTISSEYKRISEPVLIFQSIRFSGKINNSNFIKLRFIKFSERHYVPNHYVTVKVNSQYLERL
jgi:hypothetical protein